MTRGSCLCGAVRFEILGPVQRVTDCHCSMCRRAHGAAFATFARVAASDLRLISGEDVIRGYRSSAQVERSFCGTCGSNFAFRWSGLPSAVLVAAGLIEDHPALRPAYHIFVGSKAAWHEITDALPQYEARAPHAPADPD